MYILLTGSTGFLGRILARRLSAKKDIALAVALRHPPVSEVALAHVVGDLSENTDWSAALEKQQVVIHAAARAHIMKDAVADPLVEYRRVNVDGTLNMAKQAAAAGVKRLIFISSIKGDAEQLANSHRPPFSTRFFQPTGLILRFLGRFLP